MRAFSLLYRVFYDKTLGVEYIKNGKGSGMMPLLVLSVFFAFLIFLKVFFWFSMASPDVMARILSQVPEIVVQNGKITAPENYTYTYISSKKDVFFVFDTTGELPRLNGLPSKGIYVTPRGIYSVKEKESRYIPLEKLLDNKEFVLNQENMYQTMESLFGYLRNMSLVLVLFIIIPGVFFICLLMLCFYTALSYLMTIFLRTDMPFENRLRLAALSLMPVCILNALAFAFGLHVRLDTGGVLITLIYMYCFFMESRRDNPAFV